MFVYMFASLRGVKLIIRSPVVLTVETLDPVLVFDSTVKRCRSCKRSVPEDCFCLDLLLLFDRSHEEPGCFTLRQRLLPCNLSVSDNTGRFILSL